MLQNLGHRWKRKNIYRKQPVIYGFISGRENRTLNQDKPTRTNYYDKRVLKMQLIMNAVLARRR
jgi:hypothetical protein